MLHNKDGIRPYSPLRQLKSSNVKDTDWIKAKPGQGWSWQKAWLLNETKDVALPYEQTPHQEKHSYKNSDNRLHPSIHQDLVQTQRKDQYTANTLRYQVAPGT